MKLRMFRVLRPVYWRGRVYCPAERIAMREDQAAALIESGHLRAIDDAPPPINGGVWDAGLTTR
jgi:hypothetical protein